MAQDAEEFGDNAKAHGWHGWAGSMARRFRRFLVSHGERLGYDEEAGPTLDVVRRFMDWCLSRHSCVEEVRLPVTLLRELAVMYPLSRRRQR